MDAEIQENHLKAYGVTFWVLERNLKVKWLLNYRGGSFLLPNAEIIQRECQIRGVSFEILSDSQTTQILDDISSPSVNQEAVVLEKAPKIAVYTPYGKQPWDDAVTMELTYAEIPYDTIYDEEVLKEELLKYTHESFQPFEGAVLYFEGSRYYHWINEVKRGSRKSMLINFWDDCSLKSI